MKKLFFVALFGVLAQPAFAQDSNTPTNARDGFRVEARATYETPTVSSVAQNNDVYKLGSAFAYGGEAGFDIAVSDNVVVGPYVTYEISTVENCDGADCVSAENNLAAGLHIGYAVSSSGQIYGKVGYASLRLEANVGNLSVSESGNGVQGAIGYEQGFGNNFYGRVEFGYADNGKIFGINFQRRHAGVALGVRF